MPFNWTLNPYRGCTHGCHYCFARRYQTQLELGSGDEFSSRDFRQGQFRRRAAPGARSPAWHARRVAFGTATDPYQPIEGHYKLSRAAHSRRCVAGRTPVGIVTKGPMIVRDIDVLQELGQVAAHRVHQRADRATKRRGATLEPGTAHPMQRLRAVRATGRRRHRRGRADVAAGAGLLDRAGADRGDRQGHRRSRRALRRARTSCTSKAARAITSCGSSQQRVPRDGRPVTIGCTRRSYAPKDYADTGAQDGRPH